MRRGRRSFRRAPAGPNGMPPEPHAVTPQDIFLSRDLTEEEAAAFLAQYGLRDGAAADRQLQQLADDLPSRQALGALAGTLLDGVASAPDPDAALLGFCRYVATRTPRAGFIGNLHADPRMLEILAQILGTSPFLSEILIRNPEYLHWLRREFDGAAPDRTEFDAEIGRWLDASQGVEKQVNALKRFQRRELLRITARDLFGMLDRKTLMATTTLLSSLADALVDAVLRIATAEQTAKGGALPGRFAVIGMGKLGAADLNYSSDIDLIYVYDVPREAAGDVHWRYQKLGRRLTVLLSEHTGEGYLYRVDMRLRPMGSRGALVYSLQQLAEYYESLGETFERFALLKARLIAGDRSLGEQFLELVQPFVYRKYLDHAAIEELARYKARADREHARHGDLDRNVKEGRGGIREVELFVQVFQLIYGGDRLALRTGRTLTALEQLGTQGFIETDVQRDLEAAYIFFRNVEHGLQAAEGQQTHSLSGTERGVRALARRLGFDEPETLTAVLDRHRERVHAVYARLFEGRAEDEGLASREIFRLLADDGAADDVRARLVVAGFGEPDRTLDAMRALDATCGQGRSSTRNLLANLLATIVANEVPLFAPGTVLMRLERVVAGTGAAASFYRALLEDPALRHRLLAGLDAGDLYAARLAAYPEVLDFLAAGALDRDAFHAAVVQAFDEAVAPGRDIESTLDPFRRVKAIQEFKVLVEWLTARRLDLLNEKLSMVADCAVRAAARAVARRFPPTPGAADADAGWAVFALGKLGGRELTVYSDLDLVFLYAGDAGDPRCFERHQKFVRAVYDLLSKTTAAGFAYKLDTRLRPEGRMGALATPLGAFERYLVGRAEIWERMAWTRCRFIGGDAALAGQVQEAVGRFVYGPWSPEIPGYARHVRGRMERELTDEAAGGHLDLKRGRGGLADIDFLLQVLQLREGAAREGFRVAGTRRLLAALPATQVLPAGEAAVLREAYAFLRELETVLRIHADSDASAISTEPAALEPLARQLGTPMSGGELLARYRDTTAEVRALYEAGLDRLAG